MKKFLLTLFLLLFFPAHAIEDPIIITQKIKGSQYFVSLKNNTPETQIITEIKIEINDQRNASSFNKSLKYSAAINSMQSIDFPIIKTSELREVLQVDLTDFPFLCEKFTPAECNTHKPNTSSLIKSIGLALKFTNATNVRTTQLRGLNIIYKTHEN